VKRSRGRGRRPQNSSNNSNNINPNRTFDSSGPEIKIRGSAAHVYEKYLQMARDANSSGDRVMAENYLQHAEHYYRILAASQPVQQPYQGQSQPNQQNGAPRPGGNGNGGDTPAPNGSAPSFSLSDQMEMEDEEGDEATV
jgi:hypothetical protein